MASLAGYGLTALQDLRLRMPQFGCTKTYFVLRFMMVNAAGATGAADALAAVNFVQTTAIIGILRSFETDRE
jgi:hypothetical protein